VRLLRNADPFAEPIQREKHFRRNAIARDALHSGSEMKEDIYD
jgi:hypothetical protein